MNEENVVKVDIDLKKLDPLALEITNSILGYNPKIYKFQEYVGVYIGTYSRVLKEIEVLKNNKDLLQAIIRESVTMDDSDIGQYKIEE